MTRGRICSVGCVLLLISFVFAAEPKVLVEDRFAERLAPGWSFLRENAEAWRLKDGALEIRVEPGDANSVKNALVRAAPDRSKGKIAVEVTVLNTTKPTNQWEQAGLTWYVDGKPVAKLVKELVDGKLLVVPGHVPMDADRVQLRLVVDGESYVAQYRPDVKGEFKTAASGKLPAPGKQEQISIQCYHGPKDGEHWIRFDDFRVVLMAE